MVVSIIDLDIGNVNSIANMFTRLGIDNRIINTAEEIMKAEKLILPGIGTFDAGMESIDQHQITEAIQTSVKVKGTPILGICLGAQLMLNKSEEGQKKGLGLINGECKKFESVETNKLKIPHMGWNKVSFVKKSPLISEIDESEPEYYFVHSYHFLLQDQTDILMNTEYGYTFCSAFAKNNIYGVQFHPEKSHKHGMRLLNNFAKLR